MQTPFMRHHVCVALLCVSIWLPAVQADAGPVPPRIALCTSDRHSAGVANLIFVRLSGTKALDLVEREAARAVEKEWTLSTLSQGAAFKIGQMLNADGLLFIGTDVDDLHVVLVEARSGRRLFDMTRSRVALQPAYASQEACALVMEAIPVLGSGLANRRLCVLPLELADMPPEIPGGPELWLSLDLLHKRIVAQLSGTSGVSVLDREHLRDILWERALQDEALPGLTSATAVLQGRAECRGMNIDRRFRFLMTLRAIGSPTGAAECFEATETNLAECAADIATWAAQAVSSVQGDAEADRLTREPVQRLRLTITESYESEINNPKDSTCLTISEVGFFGNQTP